VDGLLFKERFWSSFQRALTINVVRRRWSTFGRGKKSIPAAATGLASVLTPRDRCGANYPHNLNPPTVLVDFVLDSQALSKNHATAGTVLRNLPAHRGGATNQLCGRNWLFPNTAVHLVGRNAACLLMRFTAASTRQTCILRQHSGTPIIVPASLHRFPFSSLWPLIAGQVGNQKTLGRSNF